MKLTDNEKREILKLIEADKPLPDKYRFLLFDDQREVELIWNGKTNEVTNIVLPFQVIEQVDEPRSGAGEMKSSTVKEPRIDANGRESGKKIGTHSGALGLKDEDTYYQGFFLMKEAGKKPVGQINLFGVITN